MTNPGTTALARLEAGLEPPEKRVLFAEVSACLGLVAPVGMGTDDRAEWLKLACRQIAKHGFCTRAIEIGGDKTREKARRVPDLVPIFIEEARKAEARVREQIKLEKIRAANPIEEPKIEQHGEPTPAPSALELANYPAHIYRAVRIAGLVDDDTHKEVEAIKERRRKAAIEAAEKAAREAQ